MRKYGKIEVGFWQNPKMRGLSDGARLLYIYLIACPHGNSVGCFVLPDGYVQADLRWDEKHVSKHVSELVSKGLIDRDQGTALTWIKGWFGHNSIENTNVAKNAAEMVRALPRCDVFTRFFKALNSYGNTFLNPFLNTIETSIELLEPEPETEPEPEPEKETRARRAPLDDASFVEFWVAWPHKVEKPAALKAYRKALARASPSEILDGVRRYVAAKPPDRPWLNPSTFLNRDRWTDEPAQLTDGNSFTDKLAAIHRGAGLGEPAEHDDGRTIEGRAVAGG